MENKIYNLTKIVGLIMAFAIPLARFAPVPTFVFTILSIVSSILCYKKNKKAEINLTSVFFLAFYFVTILLSFYVGQNISDFSHFCFSIRLPLLLFPIAFLIKGGNGINIKQMLHYYALGSLVNAVLVLLIFVGYLCFDFRGLGIEYSFFATKQCLACICEVFSHRSYISFNLITAVLVFFFEYKDEKSRGIFALFVLSILVTSLFLLLSGGRISILSFFVIIISLSYIYLSKKLKKKQLYVISTLIVIVSVFIFFSNERINSTIISLFEGNKLEKIDPRILLWKNCFEVFKSEDFSLLCGYGLSTSFEVLYAQNIDFGFFGIREKLNPHNQFFDVFMENGVIGEIFFLLAIFSILINKKEIFTFKKLWFIILVINLFFESMFDRAIGTYPLAFLLCLLGTDSREDIIVPKKVKKIYCILIFILTIGLSVKYIKKDKSDIMSPLSNGIYEDKNVCVDIPNEIKSKKIYKICSSSVFTPSVEENVNRTTFLFKQLKLNESDTIKANVYVYTSAEFQGNTSLMLTERNINSMAEFYQFYEPDKWQKLSFCETNLKGYVTLNISTTYPLQDSIMHGFVYFTEPNIEIISSKN